MKKEIKGFIVGLIFATMFSGTVAMASTIVREITYGVGVSYNGRPVQFTNDTRPFIMDGRTFLPVRTVAELTGLNVDFVDGVVHLSSGGFVPPAPAPTPTPPSSSGFNISSGGETVRITEAMHYTITPSVSGVWEFRTSNNVGDPLLELYRAGSLIERDDDSGGGNNALIRQYLTAGQTYILNAMFYNNGTGSYSLTMGLMANNPPQTPETGSTGNSLTGGWEYVSGSYIWFFGSDGAIDFYADGRVTSEYTGNGRYTITGNRIRVTWSSNSVEDFTFGISGNTLTITDSDGDRGTWRRR